MFYKLSHEHNLLKFPKMVHGLSLFKKEKITTLMTLRGSKNATLHGNEKEMILKVCVKNRLRARRIERAEKKVYNK